MMKTLVPVLMGLALASAACAHVPQAEPAPVAAPVEHGAAHSAPPGRPTMVGIARPDVSGEILLYPDATDGSPDTENWFAFGPSMGVRNVTAPTITPFLPDPDKATGAAVVVAPGGAFMLLAMDEEGYNVAQRLADEGIAAFVLKYRLRPTPADDAEATRFMDAQMAKAFDGQKRAPPPTEPRSTLDALAALKMVRARASEWGVDPSRVGMIGFSAGAMTTLNATLEGEAGERPDFVGYVYGPMLAIEPPEGAPPMFAAIAMDDPLFKLNGLGLVDSWNSAGAGIELHAYEKGGHGFGFGRPGTTTTGIAPQFLAWMSMHGFMTTDPQ